MSSSGYERDSPTQDDELEVPPLFEVGRVQLTLPAPLLHVAAASQKLVLCMAPVDGVPMRILYLDMNQPTRTHEAIIPSAPVARAARWRDTQEATHVFVDPSATHILVCSGKYTYYWTPGWPKARRAHQLDGVTVTAVAFGPVSKTPPLSLTALHGNRAWIWSPPILLGTARGDLVETLMTAQIEGEERMDLFDRWARKSAGVADYPPERGVHRLHTLAGNSSPITGIALEVTNKRAVIVVTTSSRLYEFTGDISETQEPMFQRVFDSYKQSSQSQWKTDLPQGRGTLATTVTPLAWPGGAMHALAWLTGAGVYAADFTPNAGICHADLIPVKDTPVAIARLPVHHIVAYANSIMCMNALDVKIQYNVPLALDAGEHVLGTAMDEANQTCWMYTSFGGLLELIVTDETRDLWHLLAKRRMFDNALAFCHEAKTRKYVLAKYGDDLLAHGDAMKAVECYAEAQMPSFEHVTLALMNAHADAALRRYVSLCLDVTPSDAKVPRLMLATWLVELYISALNLVSDKQTLLEEAKSALHKYDYALDPPTTYSLLARQGCTDLWLAYAHVRNDSHKLVKHWIDQKNWDEALRALSSQSFADVYYESSIPLMRHVPVATIQCWKRCDHLDVERLIPALLLHKPGENEQDVALDYLQYVIDIQGSKNPAARMLRLTRLCACDSNLPALLKFIEHASPDALDLSYALRMCLATGRREASVRLYARMRQYENAVHLALQVNDIDLAGECADLAANISPALQRELWLQCAKHVVQTRSSMQEIIKFLLRTDVLTIEDILPLVPDFSVIDGIKKEICDTLEDYVARIDSLKDEMDRTTTTAANIQNDIEQLSKRVLEIDTQQPCMHCGTPLLERQLYLFPCLHGFHADCLTKLVAQHLSPRKLRRLVQLQNELAMLDAPDASSAIASPSKPSTKPSLPLGSSLERLREHVRPQAIVEAIAAGFTVGVASGRRVLAPLDTSSRHPKEDTSQIAPHAPLAPATAAADDPRRTELNMIVAGSCPICTLSVLDITAPFSSDQLISNDNEWIV